MPPPPYSAIETERVGNHVLLTRMRGHVTRALAEGQFEQFRVLVAATPKPGWIIELGELTGFDPGAVSAGARWFSVFKDRGGERVLFVSASSAVRMVAASLAFAVHAKIASYDTLKDAYEAVGLGNVEPRPSLLAFPPKAG